uniref:Uncharacterized protein n=1 Tax=Nelumbo nucifera TaxID=4432 RepID=A0A822ZU73_NELNU|nr:TPA_asm: hypothetical protein HUJ06_018450 [Nelumbo nucifera]
MEEVMENMQVKLIHIFQEGDRATNILASYACHMEAPVDLINTLGENDIGLLPYLRVK